MEYEIDTAIILCLKNGLLFHIDLGHFPCHFIYKFGIKRERFDLVFTNKFKILLESDRGTGFEGLKINFGKLMKF